MTYFFPFGTPFIVESSSFADLSVTASYAFTALTSSNAITVQYLQPGDTTLCTCPVGYIPCPGLSVPGYSLVCLEIKSCGGGQTLVCPDSIPVPTTTTTTTTSTTTTSTTTTSTSTTSTTTTEAPTTTTTTSTPTTTTTTAGPVCTATGESITGPSQGSSIAACGLSDTEDIVEYTDGTNYYGNDTSCTTPNKLQGYYKYSTTDYVYYDGSGGRTVAACGSTTTSTTTTTTGTPGTCYTVVNNGGGTSGTIYWTDPTLGAQTTTIPAGNKINVCSSVLPYEDPAADVVVYDCGTSCTSAGTCSDCEGATTTTTTTTTPPPTTTTTTTTTTTIAPGTFIDVSQGITNYADAYCLTNTYTNGFESASINATTVNSVGTPVTNTSGATINVTVRYDTYYNNGCSSPSTTTYLLGITNGNSTDDDLVILQNYAECGYGCDTEGVTNPCIQSITSGSGTGPFEIYAGSSITACP